MSPRRAAAAWRLRSRRTVLLPLLAAGAALAFVIGVDPARVWAMEAGPLRLAAALLSLLLVAVAAVVWRGNREATRVRRALTAGISHQMRTPLAQIRMFTEMLLMGRERSEEERQAWLGTIERESHRLGDVMENLLLFVHGEEADPFPTRQEVDLGALLEDVAVGFAGRAAARRMRIDVDPPAGITVHVEGQAIRQAIGNLLDNALRYGVAGQAVTISLHAEDRHARVAVTDGGPGIHPSDRARVWDPFVRLDGDEGGAGGGLGLAVVRQVVEAHGGTVWIEQPDGRGTAVHLRLPLSPSAAPPPRVTRDAVQPAPR